MCLYWIPISQTGDQLYSDTSPYDECSLLWSRHLDCWAIEHFSRRRWEAVSAQVISCCGYGVPIFLMHHWADPVVHHLLLKISMAWFFSYTSSANPPRQPKLQMSVDKMSFGKATNRQFFWRDISCSRIVNVTFQKTFKNAFAEMLFSEEFHNFRHAAIYLHQKVPPSSVL